MPKKIKKEDEMMKKFIALIMAVIMTFALMAPATAANNEIEEIETTVNDIFDFVKDLAAGIHELVGGILAVFDKECPFCDEIHETAEEPEADEPTTDEPTTEEPTTEEPTTEAPIVDAEVPAYEVVHPEDAIYLATVEEAEEAIAAAADGAYIVLADGLYDTLVVKNSKITIAADNAVIGLLNLNSNSYVNLIGLTFDAAYADEVVDPKTGAGAGFFANIVGTQKGKSSANAHDIVIKGCEFTGTPVDAGNYTPVVFHDKGRSSYHAKNITVESCRFEVNAAYYLYLNYLLGEITVKGNLFGGKDYNYDAAMWLSSNGADLDITGNYFRNWTSAAVGTSRSSTAGTTINMKGNSFTQYVDGANTSYLYIKGYDAADITAALADNTFIGKITAENAAITVA